MARTPPPVPGAANRRRLITQFNQRLKKTGPGRRGFRGFKPAPRRYDDLPTFKRL